MPSSSACGVYQPWQPTHGRPGDDCGGVDRTGRPDGLL